MSVSTADLEVRSVQLEIMKQRLKDCEEKLNSTFENIPFNFNSGSLVNCPVNKQHFIEAKCYDKHVNICKHKQIGISPGEIKSFVWCNGSRGRVLIPNKLESEIIERVRGKEIGTEEYQAALMGIARSTMDITEIEMADSLHYSYEALQRIRSPSERATLYNYSVLKSKLSEPGIATLPPDPFQSIRRKYAIRESAVPREDIRDSKRRRKSYRSGKKMKLKSLAEETKELIELYMNKFCTGENENIDN